MSREIPIIAVTGGNRGIGFEICRQLATRGAEVVLTARRPEAGQAAADKLNAEGLDVEFYSLDVTDEASIHAFREYLQGSFGRLDVLINNAGIVDKRDTNGMSVAVDTIKATLETNTLGPFRLAQVLAPLLRRTPAGRIVNISSGMGALSEMGGNYAAYRASKAALNALTGILAAELAGQVVVNSMCPGWVRTEMGGPEAERDVAQGADTAVWLALDAPRKFTGKFFRDRQVIPW
jgi:NAD(P)-dependent dehydrogenase (short-subunit alcohol dehydrogenase family)